MAEPQASQTTPTTSNFTPRKAILPVALAVMCGALGGLGFFTFGYGQGASYLGNNPVTCANCHVMESYYDSWEKSSHHAAAVCNDCHTPHNFIGKYASKADNGFFHSLAFTTDNFKDPIQIKPRNSRIVQNACIDCHHHLVDHLLPVEDGGDMLSCVHCHASVGHAATIAPRRN
jgi:cytochrome c nitrite reductase small subunit